MRMYIVNVYSDVTIFNRASQEAVRFAVTIHVILK